MGAAGRTVTRKSAKFYPLKQRFIAFWFKLAKLKVLKLTGTDSRNSVVQKLIVQAFQGFHRVALFSLHFTRSQASTN
jgi:hypothetical protein